MTPNEARKMIEDNGELRDSALMFRELLLLIMKTKEPRKLLIELIADVRERVRIDEGNETDGVTVMVTLPNQKAKFRCTECGSNCFQKSLHTKTRLRCNGCGAWYIGE